MLVRGLELAVVTAATLVTIASVMIPTLQSEASRAEKILRQACEIVWPDATVYQVDRCTHRAMAAMGDENRLRDNELKRLLIDCERELQKLKEKE